MRNLSLKLKDVIGDGGLTYFTSNNWFESPLNYRLEGILYSKDNINVEELNVWPPYKDLMQILSI